MADKLVSMKLSKADREKSPSASPAADAPAYPWGLSVNLDDQAIEKLGIKLPKVGGKLRLEALVDVTSVSSNESKEGGKNRSVTLQITDLCLESARAAKSATATLYGGE